MRCHARRGDRATALLKPEPGVQPTVATRLTYREILDLDAEAPAVPARPRTAVYPLVGRQRECQAPTFRPLHFLDRTTTSHRRLVLLC